ncbi:MAG TPA: DUF11 domain-containing protein [Thermoanaerobaculia bacterium]|nr:DUF11 domain-containing protein [Thermoanaerobaculia bacterium]
MALFATAATSAAWGQAVGTARAFGEEVHLDLAGIHASSGPLPVAQGNPSPFSQQVSLASISLALGPYGEVLRTGLLINRVDGAADGATSASSTLNTLRLSLVPVQPLLTLGADEVRSSAEVHGPCGSALTASGSTTLVNARAGGVLGLALHLAANPAPNTVLLNLLGVRLVLNEQLVGGDGVHTRSMTVNAIHLSLNNALLAGIAGLTGDVVISHSEVSLDCPAPRSADLQLGLTASPDSLRVGDSFTYTLTVDNAGPADATGTVLTNVLPPGVTLLSAAANQGSCTGTDTLVCDLGTIPVGGTITITLEVRADSGGFLEDTASVTSSLDDPNPDDNEAAVTVFASIGQ